ncbi:MAG: hypothetical protein NTX21_06855 [Alphaproteobacteria bacterium]|nr:hypothetical protein [Alphaproteobacteria bacterium]
MEQAKRDYLFRYADEMGGVIRSAFMQCPEDAVSFERARNIMQDRYASLEVFDGERVVHTECKSGAA